MENNKSKLLSFGKAWKQNKRAYGLLYKRCPKMIISRIIYIIWNALTPYVGIYLSARIIDELAGARNVEALTKLVLITLVLAACTSLVSALILKWRETECAGFNYKIHQIFSEKMMDMDFIDEDSTKTHELYSTIEQNRNGGGWGFDRVYANIEAIISAVFTLLGIITLTVSLFTTMVPASSGEFTVLNNPLFIMLIIAIMFAITYIAPALSTKAGSYYALGSGIHNLANRIFSFFGFLGYRNEYAADVRIYRQELICEKYFNNKTDTFGSNGMFAKLTKGPIGLYDAASAAVSTIFTGVVYTFVCLKALGGAFGLGAVTQCIRAT